MSVFGSGGKSAYFLLWRESFITTGKKKFQSSGEYDRKKKVLVVCMVGCAVVSVFGSGGKSADFLSWRESYISTGKKKFQSSGDLKLYLLGET